MIQVLVAILESRPEIALFLVPTIGYVISLIELGGISGTLIGNGHGNQEKITERSA